MTFMGTENRISLIMQEKYLEKMFPDSKIRRTREDSLTWVHSIQSSPIGGTYKVKLEYVRHVGLSFFVLEPKPLALAKGKTTLPHVYSTANQKLCLFYPDGRQWNVGMLYTATIIPWAYEWLCHYELWVGSGEWQGGGTKHNIEN
jgi:hypothetical protein